MWVKVGAPTVNTSGIDISSPSGAEWERRSGPAGGAAHTRTGRDRGRLTATRATHAGAKAGVQRRRVPVRRRPGEADIRIERSKYSLAARRFTLVPDEFGHREVVHRREAQSKEGGPLVGREFEADGVSVRRGWWRRRTRAGRLRIRGARLTLLTSYGVEIDSEVLARVRATAPWCAPAGFVRLVLAGRTYWVRLTAQHARTAVDAVTAWRHEL